MRPKDAAKLRVEERLGFESENGRKIEVFTSLFKLPKTSLPQSIPLLRELIQYTSLQIIRILVALVDELLQCLQRTDRLCKMRNFRKEIELKTKTYL